MHNLRYFHSEVGHCWLEAHHGTQSQAETMLLDLGFLILEKFVSGSYLPNESRGPVMESIVADISIYRNLAHSIFDPAQDQQPHRSTPHE